MMLKRELLTDEFEVGGQHIEVTSDGRTVWVNNPICVARFCPISREFQPTVEQSWCITHDDAKPTMDDWQHFVDHVRSVFGVEIDSKHLPSYLKPLPPPSADEVKLYKAGRTAAALKAYRVRTICDLPTAQAAFVNLH